MFHVPVLGFSAELRGGVRHPRPSPPSERPGPITTHNAPTGVKGASLGPGGRGCELHIAIWLGAKSPSPIYIYISFGEHNLYL
jgi:hypothetical protein